MTHRNVIFVAVLTLLLVFVLSLVWEFYLENAVLSLFGDHPMETSRGRWESIITATVFAAIAVFVSVLVTSRVIREHERVKAALSDQFNLLQTLIDAIPVPIFFKDAEGFYLGCNRALEDYLGLPRDKIIGKGVYDIAPREFADVYHAADRELFEKGGVQTYEANVNYADGSNHDVIFHKAVFEKADGSLGGLVGAIMDVTEQNRVKKALRASERRFKNFASDAAHELRTPLSVMKLRLDDLDDSEESRNLKKDVVEMSRLLGQLLAVSRLDSQETLSMEEIDIRKICTNIAERMAPLAIRDERFIEVIGAEKPVFINGNGDALEHAVRNLVENALKYSSRRTTITIEVSDEPSISVINKGRGIPPQKRNEIFERFQRSDRRRGGAGLGLSIVQRAVEAHKGAIEVTDAPGGGGAKFTIYL